MDKSDRTASGTSDEDRHSPETVGESSEALGPWGRLCRKLFPTGYRTELHFLVRIAGPLVSQFAMGPVALIFCGRLGENSLAAAALAISMINITGLSVGFGLSTSCDTLFSQLYGSTNRRKIGTVLQKSLLFTGLCSCPCAAIMLNSERILLAIGQDPVVSRLAADYLMHFCPGLLAYFLYIVLSKYLQCQNIVIPNMLVGFAVNIGNILAHYVLVYVLNYGIRGSAISQAIAYYAFLALTIVYILMSGVYKGTWNGWSGKCLLEWRELMWLSVCGMLMTCAAWACFEISIFLAGILGTVELGAQSVIFQVENIVFMIPMSIGVASSIRIGHYLGAEDPRGAKSVFAVSLSITVSLAVVVATLEGTLKNFIPLIFTDVTDVVDLVSRILPVMAIYVIFEAITAMCSGIIRGCGRQNVGAIIMGCTAINLAVAVPLMFKTNLGLFGFWYPFAVTSFIQAIAYLLVLFCSDWDKLAERVKSLVGENSMMLGTISLDVSPQIDDDESPQLSDIDDEKIPILAGYHGNKPSCSQYALAVVTMCCLLVTLLVGILCRVLLESGSSTSPHNLPQNGTVVLDNSMMSDIDLFS